MKFMLVTDNEDWARSLELFLKKRGITEIIVANHDQALQKFLDLEPTHVLVGEYEDNADDKKWRGNRTWKDISNAASQDQVLRRCGFMKNPATDFFRLPLRIEEVLKAFNIPLP